MGSFIAALVLQLANAKGSAHFAKCHACPPNVDVTVGGCKLLNVHNELTDLTFLIDTGAEVSLILPTTSKCHHTPNKMTLYAANGAPIDCFGLCTITIRFCGQQYRWTFHVADVLRPILGVDFLGEFDLAPDLHHQVLIDLNQLNVIQGCIVTATVICLSAGVANMFTHLLDNCQS